MIYKIDMPTPANTVKATPKVWRVRVSPGVTRRVWIGFPAGCYGLCHVQVWHWGWQVWPWSPDDSFHWNNYMFTFEDRYELTTEPLEFVIRTWNLDDFYAHTPTFAVTVIPDVAIHGIVSLDQILLDLGVTPE